MTNTDTAQTITAGSTVTYDIHKFNPETRKMDIHETVTGVVEKVIGQQSFVRDLNGPAEGFAALILTARLVVKA